MTDTWLCVRCGRYLTMYGDHRENGHRPAYIGHTHTGQVQCREEDIEEYAKKGWRPDQGPSND